MNDPRMNSVHLDTLPRREDFRRARAKLCAAQGMHTLAIEERVRPLTPSGGGRGGETGVPGNVKLWIVDDGRVHPLKIGLNHIGRMPDNDIILPDSSISRRHCSILVHSNLVCELHDTASRNGTFLNGSKISKPTRLRPGDEIRICDRPLIFRAAAEQTMPPAEEVESSSSGSDQQHKTCVM
jgi:hypothetical protein